MHKARLIGLGSYLPAKVLTNADLEKMIDTTDEWIFTRTGIRERRIAGPDEHPSHMGTEAAKIALKAAQITPDQVEMILVATMTPDYISPSTAALIQHNLGISNIPCFDVQAACTGFIYALSMAKAYIESGTYNNILVIASEKMSSVMDYNDRNTCILFGDGAGAAVVSREGSGLAIGNICLGADGELAQLVIIPGGASRHPSTKATIDLGLHYFKMIGKEVFKHAVRRMGSAAQECMRKAGLASSDIRWLVPHQANIRIIEAISKNFDIPDEHVYKTLHKYGNTSAAFAKSY